MDKLTKLLYRTCKEIKRDEENERKMISIFDCVPGLTRWYEKQNKLKKKR